MGVLHGQNRRPNSYDSLYDIAFVDSQTGWAVGDFGTILHTADGGQTWTRENAGNLPSLYAIDAIDKGHRWGVGEGGIVVGVGQ